MGGQRNMSHRGHSPLRWLPALPSTCCALGLALSFGVACEDSQKIPMGAQAGEASGGAGESGGGAPANGVGGSRNLAGSRNLGGEAGASDGGNGGRGDAPPPEYPTWLGDESGWAPVETFPGCSARVAQGALELAPGLVYEECGPGCQAAKVAPIEPEALAFIAGTAFRAGELVLSTVLLGEPPLSMVAKYAYDDGEPTAMLVVDPDCIAMAAGRASPNLWQLLPTQGESVTKRAWLGTEGSLEWLEGTPMLDQSQIFDFGSSWGTSLGPGVDVAVAPLSFDLTSISHVNALLSPPAADTGVVAWGEWSTADAQGVIVTWVPGETAWVLAEGLWLPPQVAVSGERIAWLGATGAGATGGVYETVRVYFCDRKLPGELCDIVAGPELPITMATQLLATHERWIALTGCTTERCDAYVVDTTDLSAYRIERIAPDHSIQVVGVTASELFAADFGPENPGPPEFERVLRYDLAQLDQLATRL